MGINNKNRAQRTWKNYAIWNTSMMSMPLRKGALTVPSWMIGNSVVFFIVATITSWFAFGYVPETNLIVAALASVILFFYGGSSLSRTYARSNEKAFLKNVLIVGFIVRVAWVLYMYFFFNPEHFNNTYGSQADTDWYMDFGMDWAKWAVGDLQMSFSDVIDTNGSAIDDIGYPLWLGVIYLVTGRASDVLIPMLVKSFVSAYCAVLMYRVAKRHFDVGAARLAAIFVCFNPNMIYWCAAMMKETEMVFVCCYAIEKLDKALTSGNSLTLKSLWPGLLAGSYLFFFRAALGAALFVAVLAHIVMASSRIMSAGKKVIAGVLVLLVLFIGVGDSIYNQTRTMYNQVQSGAQDENMEWRSRREGGNSFAKYAGAAVFAPLIFTLPFPTFNQANADQLVQMQLAGGSYIKNILSYFVLIVMVTLLVSGAWRRHVFILAYTVGYLGILVFSGYAQSGRFHMPAIPLLMLFAAYGVQMGKYSPRIKRWFPFVLVLEVAICLAWNWFKLKGRGMI